MYMVMGQYPVYTTRNLHVAQQIQTIVEYYGGHSERVLEDGYFVVTLHLEGLPPNSVGFIIMEVENYIVNVNY